MLEVGDWFEYGKGKLYEVVAITKSDYVVKEILDKLDSPKLKYGDSELISKKLADRAKPVPQVVDLSEVEDEFFN